MLASIGRKWGENPKMGTSALINKAANMVTNNCVWHMICNVKSDWPV
jgi:hypothetical protein